MQNVFGGPWADVFWECFEPARPLFGVKFSNFQGRLTLTLFYRDSIEMVKVQIFEGLLSAQAPPLAFGAFDPPPRPSLRKCVEDSCCISFADENIWRLETSKSQNSGLQKPARKLWARTCALASGIPVLFVRCFGLKAWKLALNACSCGPLRFGPRGQRGGSRNQGVSFPHSRHRFR